MSTEEVITLSSDDEEVIPPPKKRAKLITLPSKHSINLRKRTQASTSKAATTTDETSCIILSDDEDVQIQETCDTPTTTNEPSDEEVTREASHEVIENGTTGPDCTHVSKLFNHFINSCLQNLKVPEHRSAVDKKLQLMRDAFDKYLHLTDDHSNLQQNLEVNIDNIANKPKRALVYFVDVYQLLQQRLRDISQAKQAISGKEKIIKKLEITLVKLKKRIDRLEEAECDFNDEENSTYMQVCRYKQRAAEVHAKLCKYRKLNPYSGRIMHQRLKFNQSKYPEINEAINKKYKNNTVFPTYHDIERIVRKCSVDYSNVKMSDVDIRIESKQCFEKLGNFIQEQRKLELFALHSDYIMDALDDPAKDNPSLQGDLIASYQIKVEKENAIFEKFSAMQEKGVSVDDSEGSVISDSGSDVDNARDAENVDSINIE